LSPCPPQPDAVQIISESNSCLEGIIASFDVHLHGNVLRQLVSDDPGAAIDDVVMAGPKSHECLIADKESRGTAEPSLLERWVDKYLVRHKVIGIERAVKALVIEVQIPEPEADVDPGIFLL
jgi:hypothetical protein